VNSDDDDNDVDKQFNVLKYDDYYSEKNIDSDYAEDDDDC
jgi:hypothetical protein